MKNAVTTIAAELVTIISLMVIFALVAVLTGAAIDVISPPADGESAIVKVSANRNGFPALVIAFVATMYTYRFALTHQFKTKQQTSHQPGS